MVIIRGLYFLTSTQNESNMPRSTASKKVQFLFRRCPQRGWIIVYLKFSTNGSSLSTLYFRRPAPSFWMMPVQVLEVDTIQYIPMYLRTTVQYSKLLYFVSLASVMPLA